VTYVENLKEKKDIEKEEERVGEEKIQEIRMEISTDNIKERDNSPASCIPCASWL
jgi:hypothetical protein